MKVLLWKDVDHLGTRGTVVDVKNGYARNYLIPRKMAASPTPSAYKELELEKKRTVKRTAKRMEDLKTWAAQIEKESVTITVKTNEEGHLYGSVTGATIAEAYEKLGVKVEAAWIAIDEPIKTVGVYQVKIKLHQDLEVVAKVWVVQEKDSPKEEKSSR